MKSLNVYINEAWNGVKKQAIKADIEAWCEEMGIKDYTINSQGEIDVDGCVDLYKERVDILPYKFGRVSGFFDVSYNKNLKSLKNCPSKVRKWFSCSNCPQLDSLEGCPKEVKNYNFWCYNCKREFTEEEVQSLCKVKGDIVV